MRLAPSLLFPGIVARILIMDDDPDIRALLRDFLEEEGYEVDEAPDGREGVRRFREHPADLLIVDIFMPEVEGIETILELRRHDPSLRCIAMTGGGMTNDFACLQHAQQFGAARTFTKPFELDQLLEAVQELLARPRNASRALAAER